VARAASVSDVKIGLILDAEMLERAVFVARCEAAHFEGGSGAKKIGSCMFTATLAPLKQQTQTFLPSQELSIQAIDTSKLRLSISQVAATQLQLQIRTTFLHREQASQGAAAQPCVLTRASRLRDSIADASGGADATARLACDESAKSISACIERARSPSLSRTAHTHTTRVRVSSPN
jgi:hypothetical protein